MAETRSFYVQSLDFERLLEAVEGWFQSQDFEVQTLDVHGGGSLIQVKKGGWRYLVGMASALNVVLKLEANNLKVEIGAGKWIDKVGVGAVGVVVLWPLAITAAIGTWKQSKLPKTTFEFIDKYLEAERSVVMPAPNYEGAQSSSPLVPPSRDDRLFCPHCGSSIMLEARFCSSCGKSLT